MAKAMNLGLTAWSPLAGGVLTGKYHGHSSSEKGRMNSDMMKDFMPEQQRTARVVSTVKAVSDQTRRSMAQVALAWLCNRPVPVIPIIGARKLSQLQDNLGSFDLALSAEQVKALDEASQIDPGFPYHFYVRARPRDCVRWDERPDTGVRVTIFAADVFSLHDESELTFGHAFEKARGMRSIADYGPARPGSQSAITFQPALLTEKTRRFEHRIARPMQLNLLL